MSSSSPRSWWATRSRLVRTLRRWGVVSSGRTDAAVKMLVPGVLHRLSPIQFFMVLRALRQILSGRKSVPLPLGRQISLGKRNSGQHIGAVCEWAGVIFILFYLYLSFIKPGKGPVQSISSVQYRLKQVRTIKEHTISDLIKIKLQVLYRSQRPYLDFQAVPGSSRH